MNVGQLIEKLEDLNRYATVLIEDKNNWGKCEVDIIDDDFEVITLM